MMPLRLLNPFARCGECGLRLYRCGARRHLGWRYLIRHYWATRRSYLRRRLRLYRGGLFPTIWYAQTHWNGPGALTFRWMHRNRTLQEWRHRPERDKPFPTARLIP